VDQNAAVCSLQGKNSHSYNSNTTLAISSVLSQALKIYLRSLSCVNWGWFHFGYPKSLQYERQLALPKVQAMAEDERGLAIIPGLEKPPALLPIARHRRSLLYLIDACQVTIVVAATGSGKTTQIPQFLDQAGWCKDGKMVAVTQVGTSATRKINLESVMTYGYSLAELRPQQWPCEWLRKCNAT
jgi:hypothetical protein